MTKVRLVGAATILSVLTVSQLAAQKSSSPLAASYSVKVGDMAAQMLSEMLKLRTDFSDAALVSYEPTTQTIDVEVYATPRTGANTDQARALLGGYWDFIKAAHIPYVERRFGAKLDVQNYRLMYYERTADGQAKLVLQFVNGQYTIP